MHGLYTTFMFLSLVLATTATAETFETDVVKTSSGDLAITFIGHGSVMFIFKEKVVHVDPYSKLADYSLLPKADLILITHEHRDHLDPAAIEKVSKKGTQIVLSEIGAKQLGRGTVLGNGETKTVAGFMVEAVPAYNIVQKFHPKGVGNGYILNFDKTRVYVAGDTENTPEMKALRDVAVAFLPMNLPYTMTPEMVADAARAFRPKVLYPYHYGETDTGQLVRLLADEPGIEVRIRKMA